MESTPVSQEELFAAHASAQALAEANAFKTVPTNYYRAQGTKYDAKRGEASDVFPQGRLTVNCKADLQQDGKKLISLGFFISPDVGRTRSGKLDREFRLYNQLARALYPELKNEADFSAISVGDLLGRFTSYPVGMFITETFASEPDQITGKKSYVDAKTQDEAKSLREKGWVANNYVQSIGKVK